MVISILQLMVQNGKYELKYLLVILLLQICGKTQNGIITQKKVPIESKRYWFCMILMILNI
jgi:hypothetical protein